MNTARSRGRNVWVEFSSAPGQIQGGLCAANSLTKAQFLDMLYVVFSAPGGFKTRLYASSSPITATHETLEHGRYILTPHISGERVCVSDERFFPRTLSLSTTLRDRAFRDQVRRRDQKCVISGESNLEVHLDRWVGFEAAHVFPLALDNIFISMGYTQLITHNDPPGVNSPQNGLLLDSKIHRLWDDYSLAVNPHNGYQVQAFMPGAWKFHGNILDTACRQPNDSLGILDALLRWHYEQAVLCNMRGAGEPSFEFDFPPGTDMMGEIRQGPRPEERMEAELFNRLYGFSNERLSGLESEAEVI
ncbi:hypothetical protein ASPZODRAFT_78109 [Penicilliopsis zonata CBS 506.65]|uniref:Uncharacterized protein n=1 Tax=Penicilliopsis zonata CBS 506.65 TaxID=1073090 RepID=A0A1L9S485_9EURO|nr:hypothetical protein ASPZODRAFT_78109 [Penicilliopsis zonata CBS 506.65]OJJ41988.1 hypothetical protein ASPZODRAFT_78109 [Penicilliopsis zonata CBS 506.65]